MKLKLYILIFIYSIFYTTLYGQTKISGVVYNLENQNPIPNANIYIEKEAWGTTSDSLGFFSLIVPQTLSLKSKLIINHVSYDTISFSLEKALKITKFGLNPKAFLTEGIIVEGQKSTEMTKELPVSTVIIDKKMIESKGYTDAGDLLRTNQSTQINEELSGKKTISLRGGNPENVLVLYDGIRLNNNYDNVFDLSTISLEDIQRIEIIKGSNTSLYGSEALSGIVNFIPKTKQDYTVKFNQKFGSYNSGDWSTHLNHSFFDKLFISYIHRQSGSQRKYATKDKYIENKTVNHTLHFEYNFSKAKNDSIQNLLSLFYLQGDLKYKNNFLLESMDDLNQLTTLRYSGTLGPVNNLEMSVSYQNSDNKQNLVINSSLLNRKINNSKATFLIRKTFYSKFLQFTTSYQYDLINLDYFDNRQFSFVDTALAESLTLDRSKQGAVGLVTFTSQEEKDADGINVSVSYRYDSIDDTKKDNSIDSQTGSSLKSSWDEGMLKASFSVSKIFKNINYNFMFSNGTNTRFPTLLNQLSTQSVFEESPTLEAKLAPEKNHSLEAGLMVKNYKNYTKRFNSWRLEVTYFQNLYENKFRNFYTNFSPFAFYDNIKNAELSGFETNASFNLFNNSLIVESGMSKYSFSDRAAFPLKSDTKYITNIYFQKWNYDIQLNWFKNSQQVGWLRDLSNNLEEHTLPGFSNINLHISKQLSLYMIKLKLNFNIFNLLSDDTKFNGLIIHDRRMYVGLEVKY